MPSSKTTPKTFGPYSPIRQVGDLYFTAGHIGVDPATGTAARSANAQTKQALENLTLTLATAGLSLNDVIKTTIFVTNMSDFAAINDVYVGYFAQPRPARSTVAVAELPRVAGKVPVVVEIEAVAAKNNKGKT